MILPPTNFFYPWKLFQLHPEQYVNFLNFIILLPATLFFSWKIILILIYFPWDSIFRVIFLNQNFMGFPVYNVFYIFILPPANLFYPWKNILMLNYFPWYCIFILFRVFQYVFYFNYNFTPSLFLLPLEIISITP